MADDETACLAQTTGHSLEGWCDEQTKGKARGPADDTLQNSGENRLSSEGALRGKRTPLIRRRGRKERIEMSRMNGVVCRQPRVDLSRRSDAPQPLLRLSSHHRHSSAAWRCTPGLRVTSQSWMDEATRAVVRRAAAKRKCFALRAILIRQPGCMFSEELATIVDL